MELADRILPHLIGGGNGVDTSVRGSCLVIGFDEGQFQLISLSAQEGEEIVQENVIVADGWENFLRLVASDMVEVFTPTLDMLDLESLGMSCRSSDVQLELVRRSRKAVEELNEINRILFRQGVYSHVTVYEDCQTLSPPGPIRIDIKFTKEIK